MVLEALESCHITFSKHGVKIVISGDGGAGTFLAYMGGWSFRGTPKSRRAKDFDL